MCLADGDAMSPSFRRGLPMSTLAPISTDPRCACGEEINESDVGHIADAGYPEHSGSCWECIPEMDAAAIRRINSRGAL